MSKKSEMLKRGTLKCPQCSTSLFFEQIHGMRLIVKDEYYNVKCDPCSKYFRVRIDKRYK